jgi:NADPH:quinone reductase-like Zn-dependent oxidoreductase
MRKIVIPKAGGYEQLQLIKDAPEPPVGLDQCLIQVHYAGINYADCLIRFGVYESAKHYVGWPITPGFEVSGTIKKVGDKVKKWKVGDQVMGILRFGGYAEVVAVHEDLIFSIPNNFSLEQAAGFPAVSMTAYYALFQSLRLPPRKTKILVHSAGGGVGSALVQLGKYAGSYVVGIVGSPHKKDYVKGLGADEVWSKSDPLFSWSEIEKKHPDRFDVVLDANGYSTMLQSYRFLRPTGRLVVYGSHSLVPKQGGRMNYLKAAIGLLKTPRFNPLNLITENKGVIGFNLSFLFEESELSQENMAGLLKIVGEGGLRAPKVTTYPIEDIAKAHAALESGSTTGKLVLQF